MKENPLDALLPLLFQLLAEGEAVRVRFERAGAVAKLTIRPAAKDAEGKPPDAASAGGLPFSPIETSVLKAATTQWQTAAVFAEKTQQKLTQGFYAILGNLVDRQWLESSHFGYRLRANGERADAVPASPSTSEGEGTEGEDEEDRSNVIFALILTAIQRRRSKKLSFGELREELPQFSKDALKAALALLVQSGKILHDGSYWSFPDRQEQPE